MPDNVTRRGVLHSMPLECPIGGTRLLTRQPSGVVIPRANRLRAPLPSMLGLVLLQLPHPTCGEIVRSLVQDFEVTRRVAGVAGYRRPRL